MKALPLFLTGVIGAITSQLFGVWSEYLTILIVLMVVDYATGIVTAGIFHASPKTKGGTLESRAGFKGIVRKFFILVVVAVSHQLDLIMGSNFVQGAVTFAFIANETLSIIENVALMGIPIPSVLIDAIEIVKNKGNKK